MQKSSDSRDLNKEANDFLAKHGFRWDGRKKAVETTKQASFEKHGVWHLPFRGASRPSLN